MPTPNEEIIGSDPFGLIRKPYLHYGAAIEAIRLSLELSQSEFGAMLEGVSQTNVTRYESGKTEPPLELWRKLARGLGVNVTWIITGDGGPYDGVSFGEVERLKVQRFIEALYESPKHQRPGFNPLRNAELRAHLHMDAFYEKLYPRNDAVAVQMERGMKAFLAKENVDDSRLEKLLTEEAVTSAKKESERPVARRGRATLQKKKTQRKPGSKRGRPRSRGA